MIDKLNPEWVSNKECSYKKLLANKINEIIDEINHLGMYCIKDNATLGAVGGECKFCHDDYKCPDHDKPKDKPVVRELNSRKENLMYKPSEGLEEVIQEKAVVTIRPNSEEL